KKKVLMTSLVVWTVATLLTGFSTTVLYLVMCRCVAMGGGEAFYSPSANSLIGESHKRTLSTALSIHQTALYFGVVLSSFVTGYIAELYGWRTPFFVFGAAGLLLAVWIHFEVKESYELRGKHKILEDNQEVVVGDGEPDKKEKIRDVLSVFFKKPTAVLLALAFAGMQFVGMGFMTWMPTYMHEAFQLNLAEA